MIMFQRNVNDISTDCHVQSIVSKTSLQNQKSFRLQNNSDLGSEKREYLIKYDFKQRIDSMFDETRSAILESSNINRRKYIRSAQSESGAALLFEKQNNFFDNITKSRDERKIKNMVQARIEKMFADVSSSEFEDEPGTPNASQFQVDYIGSLPLPSKITSLQGLQEPLKNLYFNYRKNKYPSSKLQALIEISSLGLKIQSFQQNCGGVKEQLNPFPSIAVWAALKFVCRPQSTANGKHGLEYAFLPIVVDQKSTEKSALFRSLDQNDFSCAIEKTYDDHSPLFVVIMRQSGSSNNRLQCHGFACASSEDAIVLAANLYKALVATMTTNMNNGSLKKRKKVKCRNGLGTVSSIAGSSVCEEQDYLYSEKKGEPVAQAKRQSQKKNPPPRPPRKIKTQCDIHNEQISNNVPSQINLELDEIISIDDTNEETEIFVSKTTDVNIQNIKNSESTKIYKTKSNRSSSICSWQSINSEKVESGDIFTKVVIPRSGSFLNSGPLTSRYNRCVSNYGNGINSSNRKTSIHSPLGFIELFNELRIHEGLNNIDEILNTIIDVDGMSFNSLKPIYKEFIFKLAVTLTKDELYQRSKSIMQKQKRRKRQMMHHRRRTFISGYKIKRAFHVSVSKLRPAKYKIGLPFSIFPALKKMQQNKSQFKPKLKLRRQNASSTLTSNDSFVLGFSRHRRNSFKYPPNDMYRDKSFYLKKGEISFHRKKFSSQIQNITSNRNDFIKNLSLHDENSSLINDESKADILSNNENISGYFTCSECSYNSETCKYKASQKCYCSMKKNKNDRTDPNDHSIKQTVSVSSCSCDTDSCIESEKCYCNQNKKPSIFEQLKQQGFAASESSLSRPSSPTTAWQRNESLMMNKRKDKTCLQASKSLEFFHVQKNVSRVQLNCQENQINTDDNKSIEEHFNEISRPASEIRKFSVKSLITANNNRNSSTETQNFLPNGESDNSDNTEENYFFTNCDSYDETSNNDNEFGSDRHRLNKRDEYEQNKILVVSARDQKGQVKNSVTPLYNKSIFSSSKAPLRFLQNENGHEADAISIKKTAEIAALFSDMKVEKKNRVYPKNQINLRCNTDIIYNSFNPPRGLFWNRMGSMCIKNINLENSLGYFP